MNLWCPACDERYPLDTERWRCVCGAVFEIEGAPAFHPGDVVENDATMWRYRAALGFDGETPVTMGEGWTPLVPADVGGQVVQLKLEYLNPTGSFKDRGASVLATLFKSRGVARLVDDSSGNAGAALAAYAARAGLRAMLYVPANTSPAKRAQIAAYGATLVPVEGTREAVTAVAQTAIMGSKGVGTRYASHVYHPMTLFGPKTVAYEIWEQLGGRAPERVVAPLGHGTLLLGCYWGFSDLLAAGLIERLPRFYGIQAAACAPLAKAYTTGATDAQPMVPGETLAEGIRIGRPIRGAAVLDAVRQTGGAVLAVDNPSIVAAHQDLAQRGFYVEPTSAAAVAALDHIGEGGETVVVLTGNGLKQPLLWPDVPTGAPAN
jgi:threonine synthase